MTGQPLLCTGTLQKTITTMKDDPGQFRQKKAPVYNRSLENKTTKQQNLLQLFYKIVTVFSNPFWDPFFWTLFGPNDCLHTYTILCVDLNCAATLQQPNSVMYKYAAIDHNKLVKHKVTHGVVGLLVTFR